MARDGKDHEAGLVDQTNLLPKRELIVVLMIMALSLCVCFIDQNGIGVLLPSIARDLHAESTIAWAGTSALIANTVFQVLYGRLSDLFGRKKIFLSCLVLLSLSDLVCGLAPTATVLYVFRGLAGVANGGIMSLSMMIVSDIVSLQERGKYQGILGSMIGIGSGTGPIVAALFAERATWRALFYLLAPLILCGFFVCLKALPNSMPHQDFKATFMKIDFLGLAFGTVSIILLLIPISEGGTTVPWNSPQIIAMLVLGGLSGIAFIICEWRFAKLPMMPLSLFHKKSVAVMLLQSFLIGANYYAYLYYLPLYYQNVHGYSVLDSALMLLPLVVAQSTSSTAFGYYISRRNSYLEVIVFGFFLWTLGSGLLISCGRNASPVKISAFIAIIGVGTGGTFQPTLVALQAHCTKAQRAVVTSNRNFLRSLGGAVSLAVSSGLMGNVLRSSLPDDLQYVAKSTFAIPDLSTFTPLQREQVEQAFADASRAVFIWCTPLIGACLLGCVFIRDQGLQRQEEREADEAGVETPMKEEDKGMTGILAAEKPIKETETSPRHSQAHEDETLDVEKASHHEEKEGKDTEHSRHPSISSARSNVSS